MDVDCNNRDRKKNNGASLADSVHVAKSAASLSLMGVQGKSCLCTKESKSSLKQTRKA